MEKLRMRNSILQHSQKMTRFTSLVAVRTGAIFPSVAFVFPNQTKARRVQGSKKGLVILQRCFNARLDIMPTVIAAIAHALFCVLNSNLLFSFGFIYSDAIIPVDVRTLYDIR
jgi:uncharacterized membrane protein